MICYGLFVSRSSCLYRNSCQWEPLITKKLQFRSKSNASFFLYQLIYWFFSLLQISCLSKNEKDKNRWIIITNTSYMLNVLLLLTEGNPEFVDYCSWWVNWARCFTIAHYFKLLGRSMRITHENIQGQSSFFVSCFFQLHRSNSIPCSVHSNDSYLQLSMADLKIADAACSTMFNH